MIGVAAIACATMLLALALVAPATADARGGILVAAMDRRLRARALRGAHASLVPTLETILAASRAGLVLREAVALGADRARGDLADRLRHAIAQETLGMSLADALASARRGASPASDAILGDLELCARSRLPSERVAALVEDELGALRFERELASDLAARTSGQRFQVWVLAAIVPALAIYLAAMSPMLAAQLSAPLGKLVFVPAGIAFEIAGILLSRRIVSRACR